MLCNLKRFFSLPGNFFSFISLNYYDLTFAISLEVIKKNYHKNYGLWLSVRNEGNIGNN